MSIQSHLPGCSNNSKPSFSKPQRFVLADGQAVGRRSDNDSDPTRRNTAATSPMRDTWRIYWARGSCPKVISTRAAIASVPYSHRSPIPIVAHKPQ
jgi:hypothetical protein